MKKIIIFLALSITLVSCGSQKIENPCVMKYTKDETIFKTVHEVTFKGDSVVYTTDKGCFYHYFFCNKHEATINQNNEISFNSNKNYANLNGDEVVINPGTLDYVAKFSNFKIDLKKANVTFSVNSKAMANFVGDTKATVSSNIEIMTSCSLREAAIGAVVLSRN